MSISVCAFLTFFYLGVARESINMPTGFWMVFLTLCNANVLPETTVASQTFTCRQTMVWFFAWLAAAAFCGDTVRLSSWKDGTGSFRVALCLSDQKARLSVCSSHKLELLFSILQISKQPSQEKGRTARTAILSFLPYSLLISIAKPLMILRRKGKKQRTGKSLLSASLLKQQCLLKTHTEFPK